MFNPLGRSSDVLTIWDSDSPCQIKSDSLLLWRQFADSNTKADSICSIVEKNGSFLRDKILRFIADVGDSTIANKNTNNLLRPDFEYFWMTQFHSRPYTQSAQLNNLAKLFALNEVVHENNISKLVVYSDNRATMKVFRSIAHARHVKIEIVEIKKVNDNISPRSAIKSRIPRPILAILALAAQIKTAFVLKSPKPNSNRDAEITFFDYWYRFAESVASDRKFGSQYWTALVDELDGTKINWRHNLVDQHKYAELKAARLLLADFNHHPKHSHEITDSKISLKIILQTLFDHLKLFLGSIPGKKFRNAFNDSVTGINFWPLFRHEWLNSMRGYEALINCLRFNRLEALIAALPKQKLGVYLIENQPWEMALIYLWRKYRHGNLVGVAHSTIRFWDLRLMSDSRQFQAQSSMPRPDCIAVNGELAKSSLIASGYPKGEIVEVEALMYLHLSKKRVEPKVARPLTILVATDYLESATRAQMKLLEELVARRPSEFRILLKPHWSQSLNNLMLDAELVSGKKDLSEYFGQADVLYCSAITSAVIDGVCAGIPVIQCLDPMSFNLSPLLESATLQTVRTTTELETALAQIDKFKPDIDPLEFFNLDPSLVKWKSLLQI